MKIHEFIKGLELERSKIEYELQAAQKLRDDKRTIAYRAKLDLIQLIISDARMLEQ